jgi:hypothetical protein
LASGLLDRCPLLPDLAGLELTYYMLMMNFTDQKSRRRSRFLRVHNFVFLSDRYSHLLVRQLSGRWIFQSTSPKTSAGILNLPEMQRRTFIPGFRKVFALGSSEFSVRSMYAHLWPSFGEVSCFEMQGGYAITYGSGLASAYAVSLATVNYHVL